MECVWNKEAVMILSRSGFLSKLRIAPDREQNLKKMWYKFARNPLSRAGLIISAAVVLVAILAPFIAPYPKHAGYFTDFGEQSRPPSLEHLFGTDNLGRDVLSRCIFGFRYSLMMAAVVLITVVPAGSLAGVFAGFYVGTPVEALIMRLTDIFLALPPLVLAMAVASVLEPNVFNAMLAICLTWWPWYSRLVYGQATSVKNEFFIQSAEVIGASSVRIVFSEMLPNLLSIVLTKASLDIGTVILIGASLSFVGLGAQPPTPDLGTMVADGAKYLPELWWTAAFPALCITLVILAFNLLGDGIRDMFATEVI